MCSCVLKPNPDDSQPAASYDGPDVFPDMTRYRSVQPSFLTLIWRYSQGKRRRQPGVVIRASPVPHLGCVDGAARSRGEGNQLDRVEENGGTLLLRRWTRKGLLTDVTGPSRCRGIRSSKVTYRLRSLTPRAMRPMRDGCPCRSTERTGGVSLPRPGERRGWASRYCRSCRDSPTPTPTSTLT